MSISSLATRCYASFPQSQVRLNCRFTVSMGSHTNVEFTVIYWSAMRIVLTTDAEIKLWLAASAD